MTNLGQHSLDLVHWMTGVKAPKSVYSTGGRFFLKDNGEVPDTQDAIIEYPGFTAVCQYRECTAGRAGQGMGGLMFHGTYGTMAMSRDGFEVLADPRCRPNNMSRGPAAAGIRWADRSPNPSRSTNSSGPSTQGRHGRRDARLPAARAELPRLREVAARRRPRIWRAATAWPPRVTSPTSRMESRHASCVWDADAKERSRGRRQRRTGCWCARIGSRGTPN